MFVIDSLLHENHRVAAIARASTAPSWEIEIWKFVINKIKIAITITVKEKRNKWTKIEKKWKTKSKNNHAKNVWIAQKIEFVQKCARKCVEND